MSEPTFEVQTVNHETALHTPSDCDAFEPKDDTEIELERLIFGDNVGFHEDLQSRKGEAVVPYKALGTTSHEGHVAFDRDDELQNVADADLFFLDAGFVASDSAPAISTDVEDQSGNETSAAWVDSDDERITVSLASNARLRKLRLAEAEDLINGKEYSKRLRRQYERLHPTPGWAKSWVSKSNSGRKRKRLSDASFSSEDGPFAGGLSTESDELSTKPLATLMHGANSLIHLTSVDHGLPRNLRPEVINVHRLKDVGTSQISAITCLEFHPIYPLLLSSGPSSTLSLHFLSPDAPNPNPLLTSLHVRSTPISTALFLPPTGERLLFAGRRRYLHVWNLDSGQVEKVSRVIGHQNEQRSMERFKVSPGGQWLGLVGSSRKGGGFLNILDAITFQWVSEVRIEGRGGVADFEWWGNGEGLVALGKGGEAVEWDGRQNKVVARWIDEGAIGTTVIALGGRTSGSGLLGGDRWIAVGSSSGIVNIYDRRKWLEAESVPERPKPMKAFDQLTTPTSHLEFSPDGQLLCIASRWKRDALRLVHLPSYTVYRNWPSSSTPLGRVTAIGWAPGSDRFAVANEQGKIRLWEIRQ